MGTSSVLRERQIEQQQMVFKPITANKHDAWTPSKIAALPEGEHEFRRLGLRPVYFQ